VLSWNLVEFFILVSVGYLAAPAAHITATIITTTVSTTNNATNKGKEKVMREYSILQADLRSPLQELAYHMGSHSVTCHPAEVTFPPLTQPKLVLDLATPEGCKAELTVYY